MISCNEFILAYSEIFKEIDKSYGKKDVKKLWKFFSDTYCKKLENYIKKDGLKGMYDYWTETMGEEGGRYYLILRDDEFILDMHCCPSLGKLLNAHVKPYKDYCSHCPALYNEVIERYGFDVDYYIINPKKAECRMHVRKKQES